MSQVIKTFLGVFLILFLTVTAAGVLGAFYQMLHAQNLHAKMIDELENSDYAPVVMEACFEAAEEAGYDLQLSIYADTGGVFLCTSRADLPTEKPEISLMEVVLEVPIRIAFFELEMKQQLFGYAR